MVDLRRFASSYCSSGAECTMNGDERIAEISKQKIKKTTKKRKTRLQNPNEDERKMINKNMHLRAVRSC